MDKISAPLEEQIVEMRHELLMLHRTIMESYKGVNATQDSIIDAIGRLRQTQRAQGRLFTGLWVALWLGVMLGFGLMPLWR